MPGADDELIRIGTVVRPHGIRGELVVAAEGDTMASLSAGARIWLGDATAEVRGIRQHKGRWLVLVDTVVDRNEAETCRGAGVRVEVARVGSMGDYEAWVDDLAGYRIESPDGQLIGVVTRVREGTPHDLLEVDTAAGSALIPMVRDWLVDWSRDDRTVRLDLPPGLVESSGVER